jgi:nucleotide-binding universal stress UspA family protein
MNNQTILTLIGLGCTPSELGPFFERARETSAHLAVIVTGTAPPFPVSAYSASPYGAVAFDDTWQIKYAEGRKKMIAKSEEIEALLATHNVSGDVAMAYGETRLIEDTIARRACLCNLVYISNDLRTDGRAFDHSVRGALFAAPAGVVLNAIPMKERKGDDHLLIAWDTSLPAARAIHAALPQILEADQITIAAFDPITTETESGENPGSDLAKWLSHMGSKVTVQQYPSGGREIGTCMLERAEELGADLVVMGAYDHARMRQAMLGGTTRTLIEQTDLPVLLAH